MEQPMLGNKILELRKAKGYTQEELADYCNLSLRTIQRIESGLVYPRSYSLKAIGEILDYDFFNLLKHEDLKKDSHFKFVTIIDYIFLLFDLRTNTMKKLSILLASTCIIIIAIFSLNTSSNAQKFDRSKYTKNEDRGIRFFFPKGSHVFISNVKDTADYKIDEHLMQEYKSYIFLDGKLQGNAFKDDTVILEKGKIEIRSSYYIYPSAKKNGITYVLPKWIKINDTDITINMEWMHFDRHYLSESDNKIYFDKEYQGDAYSGDFVIYYYGEILILN